MPKAVKTQTTTPRDEAPSAAELIVAFENGEDDKAEALIQTLSQRDFVHVRRVLQRLDTALSAYALSWKGAEFWGQGQDFPA